MMTIVLESPAHGTYRVDPEVLSRAIFRYGAASLPWVRAQAAGHAGYPEDPNAFLGVTPLDDCTLIEALIIWVDSGNHTF